MADGSELDEYEAYGMSEIGWCMGRPITIVHSGEA